MKDEKLKQKELDRSSKLLSLERALEFYKTNVQPTPSIEMSHADKIVEIAHKFYDYIEGK